MNIRLSLLLIALLFIGCSERAISPPTTPSASVANTDALTQFSLLAALAANDYNGTTPLRDILTAGDFGLGTFDKLDGEMIVLGGRIFQALADGSVRPADLNSTTPFAAVTVFGVDGNVEHLAAISLPQLEEQIDRTLPRRNSPYALRITGIFDELTLRSVPAQSPPYRPLVEVVKEQATWQHKKLRGTLIGLRCPTWMGTLNVSGYHWHFLSDDAKIGGHLLACRFENAKLEWDECTSIDIRIPSSPEFDKFDTRTVTEQDIEKIERERTPTTQPATEK